MSAIAALLIPVDFYTVYANFHVPPDSAPLFWLVTSMACLAAYIVVTLIIRNPFFGYLVGTAAGSTVLAIVEVAHQSFGFSLDWRTSGLSALAVCLILLATLFSRRAKEDRLRVFAEPFRNLALIIVGVLMPLTFGWRYTVRSGFDTLHSAMTINWWLGGFIFGWGAVHYRSRSLGVLAAISLPVAAYMAQAAVFHQAGINPAWHALGWSLLVWLYFVVGHKLQARKDDPVVYGHGRTAAGLGRGAARRRRALVAHRFAQRRCGSHQSRHPERRGRAGGGAVAKAQVSLRRLAALCHGFHVCHDRVELVALSIDARLGLAIHRARHHRAQRGESVPGEGP